MAWEAFRHLGLPGIAVVTFHGLGTLCEYLDLYLALCPRHFIYQSMIKHMP
jgi:hypothetical protein